MLECLICTPAHIEQLKDHIREADRIELTLATGRSPEEVLEESIGISAKSYVYVEDGVVLCVFGVTTDHRDPDVGIPWMIAADTFEAAGMRLVRKCRDKITELSQGYEVLFNYVHADNSVAIHWLEWCGFKVVRDADTPFLPFWRYV